MLRKFLPLFFLPFTYYCQAQEDNFSYLALGDSYTIGTAIGENNSYSSLLADSLENADIFLKVQYEVVAQNGWTTRDLIESINSKNLKTEYDLVSLLIGVNNQYQALSKDEYAEEFEILLRKSIDLANGNPNRVFVVSIPDYGVCPAAMANQLSIASDIDAFNKINKAISRKLGVSYFNITTISRSALNDPNMVASDGLHFSAKMHQLWMQEIFENVRIMSLTQ